jgi:predicted nucleic acid-binding protein
MSVFVDTSAWYALLDRRDAHHPEAVRGLEALRRMGLRPVTHDYVVVETVALLQRRLGVPAVRDFLTGLLPVAEVLRVERRAFEAALSALLGAGRRDVSPVDWISFEVMRRRGIRRALAFDEDFERYGFELFRGT